MVELEAHEVNKAVPEIEMIAGPEGAYAYMFISTKYAGISYTYMNVKIEPVDGSDQLEVKFTYDILSNFKNVKVNEQDFTQVIGDILVRVIDAATEKANKENE